jgi:ribosomal protein S18 acetylase RimI-like enzyme
MFTIRFATIADAETLALLGAKTFSETFGIHNTVEDMKLYVDKTFTTEQVKKEIEDAATAFIIAHDNDTVVGYAKLKTGKTPKELGATDGIEIERIYSAQEYIGKKVGQSLMQACIELAKSRGHHTLWLGVWEHNPRAIAFYEKWGFKKFGSHPFLLGTDLQTDFLMKKQLTEL